MLQFSDEINRTSEIYEKGRKRTVPLLIMGDDIQLALVTIILE